MEVAAIGTARQIRDVFYNQDAIIDEVKPDAEIYERMKKACDSLVHSLANLYPVGLESDIVDARQKLEDSLDVFYSSIKDEKLREKYNKWTLLWMVKTLKNASVIKDEVFREKYTKPYTYEEYKSDIEFTDNLIDI